MCTGCNSHWINVDCCSGTWCSVIKAFDSWKVMLRDCEWTVWAVEYTDLCCLAGFFPSYRERKLQEMKETRDRKETSRVNWSEAIRGWNVSELYFFSNTEQSLQKFQTAVVIKTFRLLLKLLLRAKKLLQWWFLLVHCSIILPLEMHRFSFFSPDTISNTSAQSVCLNRVQIQYWCSLFSRFKTCVPRSPWKPLNSF